MSEAAKSDDLAVAAAEPSPKADSQITKVDEEDDEKPPKRSFRFWAIIISLSLNSLAASLEGTIITSALQTITEDLGGGDNTAWVPNGYFLGTIVMQPLMAQASNVFGRRWLTLLSVALFTLGAGICGGASSMAMLIAGRVVQGLGGGGMQLMVNIILTDLVSLRERSKYLALVQITGAIGVALGPFLGGLLTSKATWRWVFYLNLPIGGTAIVALFLFLHVSSPPIESWRKALSQLDFTGNAILLASTVSILIAITWGGNLYPWSAYQIVVPLVLGIVGVGLFVTYEWTLAKNPSLPRVAFSNRTSAAALGVSFCFTVCLYWTIYFMPVYFQAVKAQSAFWSGVDTLPLFVGMFPVAITTGFVLAKWGRYKPIHLMGMGVMTIGIGLFSLLDINSSTAEWACFQLLYSLATGLVVAILLPAIQAPLDEKLVALSVGVFTFTRAFGSVWAVTIPSAIFTNQVNKYAVSLSNNTIATVLQGGNAYEFATAEFLNSIDDLSLRSQVQNIFSMSLRTVWYVEIAFAALGWLLVWLEKEVPLRKKLHTQYGLKEKEKKAKQQKESMAQAEAGLNEKELEK